MRTRFEVSPGGCHIVCPTPLWTLFDKGSSCFPLKTKPRYYQLGFKVQNKMLKTNTACGKKAFNKKSNLKVLVG